MQDAITSGMAGSAAMAAQVTSLMWLRTTVNYQYANGSGTREALRQLYAHGGIRRFYRGFPVALVHAPLSRFGDVVCYAGTRNLDLPHWQTTAVGAVGSAAWRLALMPLDTLKTSLQVHGEAKTLARKVRAAGPRALFHGYLGAAGAGLLGYYPWFFTYGALDRQLPPAPEGAAALMRNAALGFGASAVSDTVSNAVRVVKVCRQTHTTPLSYAAAAQQVVQQDGVMGLLGRGLRTKLLANGVQGATFSVAWRFLEKRWQKSPLPAEQ
jgi:hypothetical protein